MTACFHQGSPAFGSACSACGLWGGPCCARPGLAARQSAIMTIGEINLARFHTVDLPVGAMPQLRCSWFCVLVNLQLFRQLKFALRLFRPAHFAIGLPQQMVGHGVIGIHGDGALQGARQGPSRLFSPKPFPSEYTAPSM